MPSVRPCHWWDLCELDLRVVNEIIQPSIIMSCKEMGHNGPAFFLFFQQSCASQVVALDHKVTEYLCRIRKLRERNYGRKTLAVPIAADSDRVLVLHPFTSQLLAEPALVRLRNGRGRRQ